MLNDILSWIVLNGVLLYIAHWLWTKTHFSAHDQEQNNLIVKWGIENEKKKNKK
jgi:hypothetical protein